ncbi:hypothetical protein Mal4_55350 [Maioricimonas rarisocia]|uniref:Uncharacterized protein n=1 Tax=Maioricimonas rarisocia TaxID=2528026 RepID=A0A517ZFA1_9PLAN|nr:cytochrome c3 family protein [Maioricimonas rarisocia]QDU41170.1 hypothetical protein Mal4_55350 [Maioricimonas rarisocia]
MRFNFPTWVNRFVPLLGVTILGGAAYLGAVVFAATDPETLNIGHKPSQPVPFSHKTHAGRLKMDCRYCHNTVDKAAFAAVPPTSTCSNCHTGADANGSVSVSAIHSDSPNLARIRQSQATGEPVDWLKVHDLPDYVYFDHSAHVNSGVSCVSCHGRVDRMDVVEQVKTLSMTFCLDCHRNPEPHLRPLEHITDLAWVPEEDPEVVGARIRDELNIHPRTNCSTCHR